MICQHYFLVHISIYKMCPYFMGNAHNQLVERYSYHPKASPLVQSYCSSNCNWLLTDFFLSRVSLKFLFPLLTIVGTDGGPCCTHVWCVLSLCTFLDMALSHREQFGSETDHTTQAARTPLGKTWAQDISVSRQLASQKKMDRLWMKITPGKGACLKLWRKPCLCLQCDKPGANWEYNGRRHFSINSVHHWCWFPARGRQLQPEVQGESWPVCPWSPVNGLTRERLA